MKQINPKITIFDPPTQEEAIARIIRACRNCYQSQVLSTPENDEHLIKRIIRDGHTSILEQITLQIKADIENSIHLEWIRHRTGWSHAAESSRYNRYNGDKFGRELTVVKPIFHDTKPEFTAIWQKACEKMEEYYMELADAGASPQECATVLNKSIRTSDVMTTNFTGLRSMFLQRCAKTAHPAFRRNSLSLLAWCNKQYPIFFGDLHENLQIEYDRMHMDGYMLTEIEVIKS